MSEWKKYDETTFTDFGSVGETMPAEDSGYVDDSRTIPDTEWGGYTDGTPYEATIPDTPGTQEGWQSAGWAESGATIPEGMMTSAEPGQDPHPATGWLVCIEGENRGKDYRIASGYTYIGRDPAQNQVAIQDKHVSAVPSARILYDAESRRFYINETNGAKNPVYLNGALFDGRQELHAYDIIKLGMTRLLFVPLCTEKFAWGDE